jgi:hypothetical protein
MAKNTPTKPTEENVQKFELSSVAGESIKMIQPFGEALWQFLSK